MEQSVKMGTSLEMRRNRKAERKKTVGVAGKQDILQKKKTKKSGIDLMALIGGGVASSSAAETADKD